MVNGSISLQWSKALAACPALALALAALLLCAGMSQSAQWANIYGGPGYSTWITDRFNSVTTSGDGGYAVAGCADDATGMERLTVMKLDSLGLIQWQRWYLGASNDCAYEIRRTSDGGYVVVGQTHSFGDPATGDLWVLKLKDNGDVLWQKFFAGASADYGLDIGEAVGGGYYVSGMTVSYGAGQWDLWILRLDSAGGLVWQETFGGQADDRAQDLVPTSDGGVIVAGRTMSFSRGLTDVWVLKLAADGSKEWDGTYGSGGEDRAYGICQAPDGGYILCGLSDSFSSAPGEIDAWVVRLGQSGDVKWQKAYSTPDFDALDTILPASDGGFIAVGESQGEAFALKISDSGNIIWQKQYAVGPDRDEVYDVVEAADGGYVMAGDTVSSSARGLDGLVLKVDASGNIPGCPLVESASAMELDTLAEWSMGSASRESSGSSGHDSWAETVDASLDAVPVCGAYEPLPDLTGLWSRVKVSATGALRAAFLCTNIGTFSCSDFSVNFYLSKTPTLGYNAKPFQKLNVSGLGAGGSKQLRVRTQKPRGTKYIIAVVDAEDSALEADESNNLIARGFGNPGT